LLSLSILAEKRSAAGKLSGYSARSLPAVFAASARAVYDAAAAYGKRA
jgi:hypothetical protein